MSHALRQDLFVEVDYYSAWKKALNPSKSTRLLRSVWLDCRFEKEHFVGLRITQRKRTRRSRRCRLEIDLGDYEHLYQQVGLPPQIPLTAWRSAVPVYKETRQVDMRQLALGRRY